MNSRTKNYSSRPMLRGLQGSENSTTDLIVKLLRTVEWKIDRYWRQTSWKSVRGSLVYFVETEKMELKSYFRFLLLLYRVLSLYINSLSMQRDLQIFLNLFYSLLLPFTVKQFFSKASLAAWLYYGFWNWPATLYIVGGQTFKNTLNVPYSGLKGVKDWFPYK